MMEKTDFRQIGEALYSAELPNGLRICVLPKAGFKTGYAAFAVNYGGAHRVFESNGEKTEAPAGIAHFLEHKMFDLPDGDSAMSLLSANGADPNAFTSSGMTCYYFECTEHFEENIKTLLHFVSTPYFTEETVQKEMGIIAQEIGMGEDNPGITLYYNLLKILYAHHPIRDKVVGTVESISQITHETLYEHHRSFYVPSNMVLCVEGDIDPEKVLEIAKSELSEEYRQAPAVDFGEEESLLPVETERFVQAQVAAPLFYIGAKLRQAERGEALLRQRLVSQLALRLLVGSSSPFYNRLYAQGLLNRDFDYEVDYSAGTATVLIGGESNDPRKVLEELSSAVSIIKEKGFDRERFERAKRASLGARLRGLEDFDNVCVSTAVGLFDGYCALDAISVLDTVEISECVDFISEVLSPERLAISVVEPKRA